MTDQEIKQAGWEVSKGTHAGHWHKDGDRVWQSSLRRQWVRAAYNGNRFAHHRSFETLEDAINDKDGEKFGQSWKAEKNSTRDMQTGEPCGVEAADVRAVERGING